MCVPDRHIGGTRSPTPHSCHGTGALHDSGRKVGPGRERPPKRVIMSLGEPAVESEAESARPRQRVSVIDELIVDAIVRRCARNRAEIVDIIVVRQGNVRGQRRARWALRTRRAD